MIELAGSNPAGGGGGPGVSIPFGRSQNFRKRNGMLRECIPSETLTTLTTGNSTNVYHILYNGLVRSNSI